MISHGVEISIAGGVGEMVRGDGRGGRYLVDEIVKVRVTFPMGTR